LEPGPGGRGERKRAQVESFAAALRGAGLVRPGATLVDFGAGTGNLTLPLAWALPECTLVAVDAKPESVARLAARAAAAGLVNVRAVVGRIEAYEGRCDVALGLHVCGSGTDAVLAAAAARRAAFCVSPCCVGKVNLIQRAAGDAAAAPTAPTHPRSALLRSRVTPAQFARLAAAADFSGDSHVDGYDDASPAGALPRAAKAAVECDRVAAAAEAGYAVHLVKLLQPAACVRNDLIVGWPEETAASDAARLFVAPAAPLFARAR
jgi:SAM-dependent methyltransferase